MDTQSDETPPRRGDAPGVLLLEVGTFRLREPFSDRRRRPMDANSGEPWSEMDISDRRIPSVTAGRWLRLRASFAGTWTRCAQKMKELKLVQQHNRRVVF